MNFDWRRAQGVSEKSRPNRKYECCREAKNLLIAAVGFMNCRERCSECGRNHVILFADSASLTPVVR